MDMTGIKAREAWLTQTQMESYLIKKRTDRPSKS
jgi:hypothetical protein